MQRCTTSLKILFSARERNDIFILNLSTIYIRDVLIAYHKFCFCELNIEIFRK